VSTAAPCGVLALNKPAGITSFDAVRQVRRLVGERRVGHAGTLDPTATGLLPVCVGRATRLVDYFHLQPKRYRCTVRLGQTSNTLDTEGEIVTTGDASALVADDVITALRPFVGAIDQIPPMHSAVRVQGRRLYEIARAGEEIEREPRQVVIHGAELIEFRPGVVAEADIDVVCGKGTYMRVLAGDLGTALGVGGLLGWLCRTGYGPLLIADSISLADLEALDDPRSALLPLDVAVDFLPRIDLAPQLALRLRRGQSVFLPRLAEPRPQGACRAHGPEGDLLAVGDIQGNLLRPTKVLTAV